MAKNLDALLTGGRLGNKAPRILTLDIETSPHLVYTWGLYNQNIAPGQVVTSSRVLCFAAKWLDSNKVEFYSEHTDGHDEMIRQAWRLLNECDILVTYNGPAFDVKHLQREFVLAGLTPPSPFQNVDLLKTARGQFKFASNRLGAVGDAIGIGTKIETGGQALWNAVLDGDEAAWKKFKRYNIQDVRLTEQLLVALGPWVKGFPHQGLWTRNSSCCYRCGGTDLTPAGAVYTKVAIYPKTECQTCGAWNKVLRNGQTRAA